MAVHASMHRVVTVQASNQDVEAVWAVGLPDKQAAMRLIGASDFKLFEVFVTTLTFAEVETEVFGGG